MIDKIDEIDKIDKIDEHHRRYVTCRCPVCASDEFNIVIADSEPLYYCTTCDTHINRRNLVKVEGHQVGEFKRFELPPRKEPEPKKKKQTKDESKEIESKDVVIDVEKPDGSQIQAVFDHSVTDFIKERIEETKKKVTWGTKGLRK